MTSVAPNYVFDDTGLNAPASNGFDITPDDANDLPRNARSLLIGGQGDVRVDFVGGATITLPDVTGIIQVRVKRVYATGTAGGLTIVGLY